MAISERDLLSELLFLEFNGFKFDAREQDAAQAVMAQAAGKLDEKSFSEWRGTNSRREGAQVTSLTY